MLEHPRSIVWRHLYRDRLRWAIPTLLIEESSDRVVTLLVPSSLCKAPASYGQIGYVQQQSMLSAAYAAPR
jgi:hypothetical protein